MMYYSIFNVFLILLLTWSSPVSSETPLQAAISSLNDCASNCIATTSRLVGCGATDFGCQCSHQDAIIGPDRRSSLQNTCILRACGPSNTSAVRSIFNKICGLQAASSALGISGSQSPAPNPAPSSTQVNNPSPSQKPISILTPQTAPPAAATSVLDDVPNPQSSNAQVPASFTPTTQIIPTFPSLTPENTFSAPLLESATSASIPIPTPSSSFPSSDPTSAAAAETTTPDPSAQEQQQPSVSSLPDSSPFSPSTTPLQPSPTPSSTKRPLPPLAIAGVIILIIGFIVTLLSFFYLSLRRRQQRHRISYLNPEEKLRPETSHTWVPFQQGKRGEKARVVMGVEKGPRGREREEEGERPKSRGKGGGNGTAPPPQFPMLGLEIGIAKTGGEERSPLENGIRRVGTGGSGPLKSAMKKPREQEQREQDERSKSRPIIGKGDKEFMFGFDPLGSNPRSPM